MELSPAQQERYSRHLLLEGVGGQGQESLCQSSVAICGQGEAALWAARYLAACGVGTLIVEAEEIAAECRLLNGEASVSLGPAPATLHVDARAGGAFEGARSALAAFRMLGFSP